MIIANVLQAQDDIMIRQFPDNPFLKEVQQRIDNKEGSRLSSPTIIFGDIFTFKYGSAGFTSSAALSANKFVVAFTDDGDNEAGKREFDIARTLNIKMAFTAKNGNVFKHHANKLTSLPRIGVNENWSNSHIDLFINGFTPFLNKFR